MPEILRGRHYRLCLTTRERRPGISEEDPQSELHLPGHVGLPRNYPETGWIIDVQRRVGGLEMIQHIHKLETQCGAHAFAEAEVLVDRHVQVPRGESAQDPGAALSVHSKNPATEIRVHRAGILE